MEDKKTATPPDPIDMYSYEEYYDAPDGKRYRWDPDFGAWYQVMTREEWEAQSHWQKFSWLYWIIVLAILCFLVEVYK